MGNIKLSEKTVRILTSKLLKMAAETYLYFGCNDLDDDFFDDIPKEDVEKISKELDDFYLEEGREPDTRQVLDYRLMRFLAGYIIENVSAG